VIALENPATDTHDVRTPHRIATICT